MSSGFVEPVGVLAGGACVSAGLVEPAGVSVKVWLSATGSEELDICKFPPPPDTVQLPDSGHKFACSPFTLSPHSTYQLDSTEGS